MAETLFHNLWVCMLGIHHGLFVLSTLPGVNVYTPALTHNLAGSSLDFKGSIKRN